MIINLKFYFIKPLTIVVSKANEEMFLDPMPVLCVLSTDGILFMYHVENQLNNYSNICKAPSEISDNVITQLFTTDSKIVSYYCY